MDFTTELSAFQGALISADNVHQFSKLTSKGGNEEKIQYVVQSVKRFLQMEKYLDEDGLIDNKLAYTQKFAMYVVLNTDLPVLQVMVDIDGIEPLIWSIPTVPKHLMCEMMWQFNMERFVYEIIPNSWPQLGLEVAEAFLINFKYFTPTECLLKLYKLSMACYKLICKLTCFKFQDNVLSNMLATIFVIFQKYLIYYNKPPNEHKLDFLSTDQLYKYKGRRLSSMLYLLSDCFTLFTGRINTACDNIIYTSTYNPDNLHHSISAVCDSENKLVVECLNNCNALLLNVCQDVVMDISVDIFCAWSEFEEEGRNMQHVMGDLFEKIQQELVNAGVEHPVVSMIQLMARKPTNFIDIINSTNAADIIEKINSNNEESLAWLYGIVHKEQLCQEPQLLDIIKSNLSLFDSSQCFKLFNNVKNYMSSHLEYEQHLNDLQVRLFQACNVTDKHTILKEHFSDKKFHDWHITQEFESRLLALFNKFISSEFEVPSEIEVSDVLTVFYHSPQKVFTKICALATQNTKLSDVMLKLMILLQEYTDHYYESETEPCIIITIKGLLDSDLQENCINNCVEFISKLKYNRIITGPQLLMLIIMPGLHSALLATHIMKINIQVKLLKKAHSIDELILYRAPMLVMLAQIMEKVRLHWAETFEHGALDTVQLAIQLQKSIMDTYKQEIPDSDGSWLRRKVKELDLHPLNFYYFKPLWIKNGRCFFESITEEPVDNNNLNTLAMNLKKIIPWAIIEEWGELWDNFMQKDVAKKDTLRVFMSAFNMLVRSIGPERNELSKACIYNCCRHLVQIIRYKYFSEPLTDHQVRVCVSLLPRNLASLQTEDVDEISTIITPLFVYLAERKNDYTVNVNIYFINTAYIDLVNKLITNE